MTRKILAVVGMSALLVAASFVGLGAVGAQSSAETPADRTISVSATGEAEASPDQAVVRVSVVSEGNTSSDVREDISTGAEELRTALDEIDADYETESYSIEQRRVRPDRRGEPGSPASEGTSYYRGAHRFTITVDDTDTTGPVIDAATNAGAEINDVRLTLSDDRRTELRDQAITDAMDDAQRQATTLAAAGDLSVTTVATIEASQGYYRPVRLETAAASGDGSAGGAVIESGDVSVTYDVQVTYNATA
jgi:uncharacterized protein YggE